MYKRQAQHHPVQHDGPVLLAVLAHILQLEPLGQLAVQLHCAAPVSYTHLALFLDRELLFQVYENLLSNAGRYAQTTVWTQVLLEGNMLSLTVRDDGPGFSPTALKRASDPYYRADKSPSPQGEMHFGLRCV